MSWKNIIKEDNKEEMFRKEYSDEDIKEIEIDLQNAKAEVSELFENVDIDIEVEVENLEL